MVPPKSAWDDPRAGQFLRGQYSPRCENEL